MLHILGFLVVFHVAFNLFMFVLVGHPNFVKEKGLFNTEFRHIRQSFGLGCGEAVESQWWSVCRGRIIGKPEGRSLVGPNSDFPNSLLRTTS